jgi:hypothetical protein
MYYHCFLDPVCARIRSNVSVGVNGIVWPLGGMVEVYYGWWGFKSVSEISLGEIVESSFRWLLSVYSA